METWAETVANTSSGEGCPAGGAQRWTLTSSARLVLESEMEGRASGAGAGTTVKRFLFLLPREPRVVQMVAPTPVHDKTIIGNHVRSKYPSTHRATQSTTSTKTRDRCRQAAVRSE
jgi:hypothetical protein